jgi:hypothetical protein
MARSNLVVYQITRFESDNLMNHPG